MYKTSIIIFFLRNFMVDFVLRSNQGINLFIYLFIYWKSFQIQAGFISF